MPAVAFRAPAQLAPRTQFRRPDVLYGLPPAIIPQPPVTFPGTPLDARVYIALGADLTQPWFTWRWEDITAYVRHDMGVAVSFGRRDEASRVTASRATLKLSNPDGRFSRKNPRGPYFGLLSRNTPIRMTINPGNRVSHRYFGFINEWPTRWTDESGTDSTVTVSCAGILRRLGQGAVLKSAMYRSFSGVAYDSSIPGAPVAYWPLEDGSTATQAASGVPGGTPMNASGAVTFAGATTLGGSDPVVTLSATSQLSASVPAYVATGRWIVRVAIKIDAAPAADTTLLEWTAQGSFPVWRLKYHVLAPGDVYLASVDAAGAESLNSGVVFDGVFSGPAPASFYGAWWIFTAIAYTTGSSVFSGMTMGNATAFYGGSGAILPGNHGNITGMRIVGGAGISVGHVGIYTDLASITDWATGAQTITPAITGWAGERAHARVTRLCREEHVPITCNAVTSAKLGAQPSGDLLAVLQDAADADLGVLYESEFGLGYQALSERYNRTAAMALDFNAGHIAGTPEPSDDDQRLRNRWTISRKNGSNATASDPANIAANQTYADSATLNVQADTQLPGIAGFLVARDTVDVDRWPVIPLRMHATPSLIDAWTTMPYGSRITIANPPSQVAPYLIDVFSEGYDEHWDTVSWDVALNATPAAAYAIGVYGVDSHASRYDSANSSLSAEYSASATSLVVVTDAGHAPWITTAAFPTQFPFDVNIAGIRITVTAITGAGLSQTFTVTRSVDGFDITLPAASKVRLWTPARWAL